MKRSTSTTGFTLIELLISMAIFAVLASVAYYSLNSIIKQSQILEEANTSLAALQKAITLMERDFMQMSPRSIRIDEQKSLPALYVQTESDTVEFTRDGRSNYGQKQSSLLRVQYQFEDNKITRKTWSYLDRAPDAKFSQMLLLQDVDVFQIQFLGDKDWVSTWEPVIPEENTEPLSADETEKAVRLLPRAIRIDITLKGFGTITRYILGAL